MDPTYKVIAYSATPIDPLPLIRVTRATKADEIALVLEHAILAGELAPGAVLRQEQLSDEFAVSRTPIREALRQLAALGLVSFAGQRGVRVRPLSQDELLETFTVRAALEGYAAELAKDRLTKAELRSLSRAGATFARLTRTLREASRDDHAMRSLTAEWVQANDMFHDVYIDAAGVQKLAEAARSARRVFRGQAVWSPGAELNGLYTLNLEQHEQIIEAFTRRSDDTRLIVEKHILDSARLLERALAYAGYDSRSDLSRRVSWL